MQGSSWLFDNQLLLLNEVNGDEQISEVSFNKSPCWIRIYDVLFPRLNAIVAKEIGECIGGLLEYDDSDPLGLDQASPMQRGKNLRIESKKEKSLLYKLQTSKENTMKGYEDPETIKLGPPSSANKSMFHKMMEHDGGSIVDNNVDGLSKEQEKVLLLEIN
ncbi:maturase K [Bienertia sinuspersici]